MIGVDLIDADIEGEPLPARVYGTVGQRFHLSPQKMAARLIEDAKDELIDAKDDVDEGKRDLADGSYPRAEGT